MAALVLLTACHSSERPVPLPASDGAEAATASELRFGNRAGRLDALFSDAAAEGGSYLLRYDQGDHSFSRAYGYMDCARTIAMSPDALFDAGSITKVFTAAAVYKLVEQGLLSFDDQLGDLFESVPSDKRNVTISHLLEHRSGFPDLIGRDGQPLRQRDWAPETYDYAPLSRDEMLSIAWSATLLFEPGTREAYSNFGYGILAAVVERFSGESYEAFVRNQILLRAGMPHTGYRLPDFSGKPIAEQCRGKTAWHDPISRGLWVDGVSWYLMGSGGMLTTIADLAAWNRAVEAGRLFRTDIQERFRSKYFSPSDRCRADATFLTGSNGMTRTLLIHLLDRRETLLSVSTHSDHRAPREEALLNVICAS